jgi:hypothetical protein
MLIRLNSSLRNAVFKQHVFYTAEIDGQRKAMLQMELDTLLDSIHEQLMNIEKWLAENLKINVDSKTFEFNEDQLKVIDEERNKNIDSKL